ncbi:unnamed protein product [Didymodactylos carnosus]|uniref:Uncharacterized protein n=1 Tax=Didymodactylos carnosus TaxID=1234261 RepID=A0A814FXS3_9BILA|nr:unnamed protein product [Didymodactylos carnosus]CAF1256872.1 unnamed protein product [Didymodactylos carnosus]CAF3762042.1 unnamed protein product [Didymodactylos carnosus]CAF4063811.1 unnamed protein product [Didymodactylos carnosus]
MKQISADRIKGSILGSLVADCAATPLHWVYDGTIVAKAVGKHKTEPEFHPDYISKYYHPEPGSLSTYGEENLALLNSLAGANKFDIENYKQKIRELFTNPKYEKKGSERPVGYLNKCIRHFLSTNGSSTPDDDQANCYAKIPPLVCLYAGHPDFIKIITDCIKVTQSDQIALDYGLLAARLLEKILLCDDDNINIENIMQELAKEDQLFSKTLEQIDSVTEENTLHKLIPILSSEDSSAILQLGNSCHLPGNFELSTYFIRSLENNDNYKSRIRRCIVATGDNCSRILFIGSCLGAINGLKGIPDEWINKTKDYKQYEKLADSIVDARKQLIQKLNG